MKRRRKLLHLLWILPLLAIAALAVIGTVTVARWVGSDDCRSRIEDRMASVLHAKTSLAPLAWGWFGVSTPRLEAEGNGKTALKRLEAAGLKASLKLSSLLHGVWGVDEITLESMKLHLGASSGSGAPSEAPPPSAPLPRWIPSLMVVNVIRGNSADIVIETSRGHTVDILGTRLEARPEGDETRFEAHGGKVVASLYPDLKLDLESLRCRVSSRGADLTGADLTASAGGKIRLEGKFPAVGESSLSGNWEHLAVAVLIPKSGDHISGNLSGNGSMTWGSEGIRGGKGTFRGEGITLTGIPALDKVAMFTGIAAFRNLPVQNFSADYTLHGASTEWRNICLESQGLLKCTGEVTVSGEGALSGVFRIGITTRTVDMMPFARELLGLEEREGYVWIRDPMHLSGTLSHPVEDVTPRLMTVLAVGTEGMIRNGLQTGMDLLGIKASPTNAPAGAGASNQATPLPSAVTNAVEGIKREGGAVLDSLGGFLR